MFHLFEALQRWDLTVSAQRKALDVGRKNTDKTEQPFYLCLLLWMPPARVQGEVAKRRSAQHTQGLGHPRPFARAINGVELRKEMRTQADLDETLKHA